MAISEIQLETWSHQGSIQQSAATYAVIKQALNDPNAPFAWRDYSIFLQGSYRNSTNVRAESDVDIVICLSSTYYSDISCLNDVERARYNADRVPSSYSFDAFKGDVTDWLRTKFGTNVSVGSKAISVPGSNGRRNADVLACVEHRDYYSYPSQGSAGFINGICFWTAQGDKIVNYPKQHMENCTAKHDVTSDRFKPNIRVLKNMRKTMVDIGCLGHGAAPSYFLEGLLYNVPDRCFSSTYQQSFENALTWLLSCDASKLLCANECHFLIRDGSKMCWNMRDYHTFLYTAQHYWNA